MRCKSCEGYKRSGILIVVHLVSKFFYWLLYRRPFSFLYMAETLDRASDSFMADCASYRCNLSGTDYSCLYSYYSKIGAI